MAARDLNLLVTLDALLSEGSVAKAAQRLRLSPSAMSRALARVRAATGDPLLVRAGRGLAPTPRGQALQERVRRLVEEAEAVLRPEENLDLATLNRTFSLRVSDGFVESFGAVLLARVDKDAPGVRLNFLLKADKDSRPLRDGKVDLETGVVDESLSPEIRAQSLFRDELVGVVRAGHPLAGSPVSAEAYREAKHVIVSRSGTEGGAVDRPYLPPGVNRQIGSLVDGFSAALTLARGSDLVATVPDRHTANLRDGMYAFALPIAARGFTISMLWHPRMDADLAHRWLRTRLREVCG